MKLFHSGSFSLDLPSSLVVRPNSPEIVFVVLIVGIGLIATRSAFLTKNVFVVFISLTGRICACFTAPSYSLRSAPAKEVRAVRRQPGFRT